MVRPITNHVGDSFFSIPLAIGVFVSASLLVVLCAKHAKLVRRKYESKTSETNTPEQLMITTSTSHKQLELDTGNAPANDKGQDEESGVWQKAILMGEKCRPLQFSGVIYYDCAGNRIPELPRSPRASPMSPLRNFAFPVVKLDESVC